MVEASLPLEENSQLSDLDFQQDFTVRDASENTLRYTKEEFDDTFEKLSIANPDFTTDEIIKEFAEGQIDWLSSTYYPNNPEYMTLDGIRNMDSPFLDDIPGFDRVRKTIVANAQAQGPNIKPVLSYREMISLIARDEKGNVIESPSNMEGFGRAVKEKGFGNLLASGGFWGGVKVTNMALSGIPPTNPLTGAIRIGGPIVGGLISMLGAKMLGDEITEKTLEATGLETQAFIPGTSETGYYAGDLTTAFVSFAPISAVIPTGIDLGSKAAITIAEELGKKIPYSTRATAYLEKMLSQTGEAFRARPAAMGAVEAVGGGSSVAGGTAMYDLDPEADVARLLVEMGAGVTGASATNFFVNKVFGETGRKYFGKILKDAVTKSPSKNLKNAFAFGTKKAGDKTENAVAAYIIKVIEESGENVGEIIKKLESDEFTKIVNEAGEITSIPLIDDMGNPIELTASMKSQSVALMALERAIEKSTAGLGKERASANLQIKRTLRNTLTALYATGDKKATQEAAELMEVIFTNNMENDLKTTIKKLVDSFQKVRSGSEPITLATGEVIDSGTSMTVLSKKLSQFLNDKNDEFRTQGQRLWNTLSEEIGGVRLDRFRYTGPNGEVLGTGNTPNVLSAWRQRVPLPPRGTDEFKAYKKALLKFDGLTELESFVVRIEKELADAANPEKPDAVFTGISFKELQYMRSIALGIAKQARSGSNPNPNAADVANIFAQGILKDLESLPETDLFNLASSRSIRYAYDAARAHTQARKSAFNQTFLRKIFQKDAQGELNIAPEELINQLLKGDQAYLKTAQLDGIGKFELNQSLAIDLEQSLKGRGQEVLDDVLNQTVNKETGFFDLGLLQTYLTKNSKKLEDFPQALNAIQQALDSSTTSRGIMELGLRRLRTELFPDKQQLDAWLEGTITDPVGSMTSIRNWMKKEVNQNLLNMFPDLKNDLQDLDVAKALLDKNSAVNIAKNNELKQTKSFKSLLLNVTENPVSEINKVLKDSNQTKRADLDGLLKAIKNAPETWSVAKIGADGKEYSQTFSKADAMEGFRSSIIESVMEKGGKTISTFDPATVYQAMFKELPVSDKLTLSDWMISNDLLTKNQSENIQQLLNNMMEAQLFATVGGSAADLDGLATRIGPAIDLYLRVAGSQAGANLQRLLPGESGAATLVAAGAGSKAFRGAWQKVFANIPDSLKQDFMEELFKNPKRLGQLLRETDTNQKTEALAVQFLNSLVKDGLAVPRRQVPLIMDAGDDRSGQFGEAVDYIIESITPWNEETDAERRSRERIELQSNVSEKNKAIAKRVREERLLREENLKKERLKKQNDSRTSFLQRPSNGNPPTTSTGPASGPGTSGTRYSAMSEGEKYDALFGNSGIGSLMS